MNPISQSTHNAYLTALPKKFASNHEITKSKQIIRRGSFEDIPPIPSILNLLLALNSKPAENPNIAAKRKKRKTKRCKHPGCNTTLFERKDGQISTMCKKHDAERNAVYMETYRKAKKAKRALNSIYTSAS